MLLERVSRALADLRATDAAVAVWIAHAGVIRAVSYLVNGGPMPIPGVERWPREAPAPGGGVCLKV